MVARRITERMARAVTGRVVSRKMPRLIKMLIMMRVTSDKESGRTISDGTAAAAKGAGTPRARAGTPREMHAPPMVDACSRTARHPSSRAMTDIKSCGCKNAGGQAVGSNLRF